ncbi:MAG: UDP-N-acetylmuramoyl-L-alanine--D-glutamate ligase, partial [Patescibacteria group bacterium]
EKAIPTLPQIKWRQEKVFENEKMAIYNDTAATSPEATITALNRFGNEKHKIFICGGTDRELDFQNFGEIIRQKLQPEELILLSGSATEKMKAQIGSANYKEFDTLKECLEKALQNAEKQNGKTYIVFSPGAKSFEKFKNEFDRGEQFNLLIKNLHS